MEKENGAWACLQENDRNMLEKSDVIFTCFGWRYCSIKAVLPFKSYFMMLFYTEASHPNGVYRVYSCRCGS